MSTSSKTSVVTALGILLLIAGGAVDGYLTNRWTDNATLREATARVDQIPAVIGEWKSDEVEIPKQVMLIAEATAATSRVYRHPEGEAIQVMLLCGPHGPISVHPPTVCFVGAGWGLEAAPNKETFPGPGHDFWSAQFQRQSQEAGLTRIQTYWAWNKGNGWQAAANPRVEFAGEPYLYKLYITWELMPDQEEPTSAQREFLDEFLRAIDQPLSLEL